MKSFQLTLSLAAALSLSALAQGQKQIHFEVADVDADFALALLSLDNGTVPFLGNQILADADAMLILKKVEDGRFVSDDMTLQWVSDLWWQGVTFDMEKGLEIHPIQKIGAGPAVAFDVEGLRAEPADGSAGAEPKPVEEPAPPAGPPAPLGIELSFVPSEDGTPSSQLQARFVAPTSDFGLVLVNVRVVPGAGGDAGGGSADVYLYHKLPGEGEGLLDVVEEHTVVADVAGAQTIRVFIGQGTASLPGKAVAWGFATTLVL
ncbi:MAG TPA: hypothetical protein VF384_10240 [Planctomycetota bacterium]